MICNINLRIDILCIGCIKEIVLFLGQGWFDIDYIQY